jgi:hypothetical protein
VESDDYNPFTSHGIRLTRGEWIIVAIFTVVMFTITPMFWKRAEKLEIEADYRMPFSLSSDYWEYARFADIAAQRYDTLLLGDSVIWGQYVTREQTLSHHLNELAGKEQFGNLGLDGTHPLALSGLIEDYGAGIQGKNVILLCNALWMSSPKHDLQIEQEFHFNHPKLVPQFSPAIPCYKESTSARLGIVVERHVPFNAWTGHLQSAYFDQTDIPAWTLEHPYAAPWSVVNLQVPPSDNLLRHEAISWSERGAKKQSFPFVDLDRSLQWHAFQKSVEILKRRGNSVFVVISPLNEHMLDETSQKSYVRVKSEIEAWLKSNQIRYCAPATLPSEEYADASHPLNNGYRLLARAVFEAIAKKDQRVVVQGDAAKTSKE